MARRTSRGARLFAGVVAAGIALLQLPTAASAAPQTPIIVSEVAPWASGNTPYAADWFELTNTSAAAVSIAGWKMDDDSNSATSAVALQGITSIAAGQSVIFIEGSATQATAFVQAWFGGTPPPGFAIGTYSGSGVGLSTSGDAVNIFDSTNARVTGVRFGASPANPFATFDNSAGLGSTTLPLPTVATLSVAGVNGAFVSPSSTPSVTEIGSPGTAPTDVTPPSSTTSTTTTTTAPTGGYAPWPGGSAVAPADAATFNGNMSGLDHEAGTDVLWAVRNGPGTLFRLVRNGAGLWVPDTANDWGAGKALRYPNGTGDPDAEGVTFVGEDVAGGIYVSTERNNAASSVSRNSILRFDTTAPGATLIATHEWNVTATIPANGANLGLEAITWIDDTFLVANGFVDARTALPYSPADYPGHGTGLFFVGVEGTGTIHVFALDHIGGAATLLTSFPSGFPAVMELQFDRDLHDLWAVCDDTCNGRTAVFRLGASGAFERAVAFERPSGMANLNNEGFAIGPASACVDGYKPVWWADDNETDGDAIRSGTLPCEWIDLPPAVVDEFPLTVLASAMAAVVGLAWLRRRSALA